MDESEKITVSIVVPVYNTPLDILKTSLDSIKNQTYHHVDVILVDDGSHEEIATYCDIYASRCNGWRVLHQNNRGASSARNKGLSLAIGKYVQFTDSDDIMGRRMVERLVRSCEENKADIAICRFKTFEESLNNIIGADPLKELGAIDTNSSLSFIFNIASPSIWKMMFRMSLLKESGLQFDSSLVRGEDLLFGSMALILSKKLVVVNEHLYYYRAYSPSSIISSKDPKFLTTVNALKKLKTFLENKGLYEKCKISYVKLVFNGTLLYDYDFIKNSDLFINQYRDLHEFSKQLIGSVTDELIKQMKNDNGYIDTVLVAEIEEPINFFAQKVKQDNKHIVNIEKNNQIIREEVKRLEIYNTSLQQETRKLEATLERLNHIKPATKQLINNIKRKMRT